MCLIKKTNDILISHKNPFCKNNIEMFFDINEKNDFLKVYNENKGNLDQNMSQKNGKKPKLNELEKLYNFMSKCKNDPGKKNSWTHSMTYRPYGSYNISDGKYEEFKKLYVNVIVAGHVPHITEAHKKFGPIVIDLDFVQPKEKSERYYTSKTIKNVVKLYNQAIEEFLVVNSVKLQAYVLEKQRPILRKNEYHDGLHIVYPYICTEPALQMSIRQRFMELVQEHETFKNIPLKYDLDKVVDKGVIYNVGWLMYGSTKDDSSGKYLVTHIYTPSIFGDKLFDTMMPHEKIRNRENIRHFVNVLSCRRFNTLGDLTNLSPSFLKIPIQINTSDNFTSPKKITTSIPEDDVNPETQKFVSNETDLEECKILVSLFSENRADEYNSWYQVGKCLHNIDYRLLDVWIEFSKKSTNFKEGECEKLWKKMKLSNYSLGTLHYFASNDNKEKYLEMKNQKLGHLINASLDASHTSIAKLLFEKYRFVYKCASIKPSTIWYEFKNHRWHRIDSAHTLRARIDLDIIQMYDAKHLELMNLANTEQQTYKKNQYYEECIRIVKIMKSLGNKPYRDNIIAECAYQLYDEHFLQKLDENINLICFENGVYDLDADIFREGYPDDYISLCTNYDYLEYDKHDPCVRDINDFIKKIQPNKEIRDFVMMVLSTCLSGAITNEHFYVFTGSGANGKSKLMELMKYTMGNLFKPMDIMVIVGKRTSSSAATPELADKKGIRICPFDEPKATDEINTSFMKIFTGGDLITARALFQEPIYYKPQFKPFLLCNQLPNIKSDDDGTWRRFMVVPFLAKFIKKSEISKKRPLKDGEHEADLTISSKLPEWKQMFMCKLLQYYRKYKVEGLKEPKLVKEQTQQYRKNCDVFQDFIGDYLEKTEDKRDILKVVDIQNGMKSWCVTNHHGKAPIAKDIRNYMRQRMPTFDIKLDALVYYRIKTNDGNDTFNQLNDM